MFRQKNSNTKIENVEATVPNIDLNARGNTTLGNLLRRRGFQSQSQLLRALRGQLTEHASQRRLFLSFHAEDRPQVNGFRLAYSPSSPIDFYDGSVRTAINSLQSAYIRSTIREKIGRCSVVVCLIGDGTAWRDWVDWELETAVELGKGVCGVRLKGSGAEPQSF